LLGNVTLVYPLERLYNSAFHRNWEKTCERMKTISPGDLEEMDYEIGKLERYYNLSGIRKLSVSFGAYPDQYAVKIKSLRGSLNDSICRKFRSISSSISHLVGDPVSVVDLERDKKRFDDALVQYKLLAAFYRRWKLDTLEYRNIGDKFDYAFTMKEIAYNMARKRVLLLKEHVGNKRSVEYKQKLGFLSTVSSKVSAVVDAYHNNYLNIDGNNASWSGLDAPWVSVDYVEDDKMLLPLERLRKVPSSQELSDLQNIFTAFVDMLDKGGLIDEEEKEIFSDYNKLKGHSVNFSLGSDDADERLKAGVIDEMLKFHKVYGDALSRAVLRKTAEKLIETGFAMYFAPLADIYKILEKGSITADSSASRGVVFRIDSDIGAGDMGFIFPLSKVVDDNLFYQAADEVGKYVHVLGKSDAPVEIDIRKGIFIAPKDLMVRYNVDGNIMRERSEDYFRRFFSALAGSGSQWFDHSRLQGWLSRHCVFYDDSTRSELLGLLRDKYFVSIMNRFTNRDYDNLSLAHVPGTLKVSEYYVPHKLGDNELNVTLFEWEKKDSNI